MPIPFPGMNPYLEHPDLWPTVHQRFVIALSEILKHRLPAAYRVRLKEHRYQVSGEDSLVVGAPGLDWGQDTQTLTDHSSPLSGPINTPKTAAIQKNTTHLAHKARGITPRPISVLVPVPQKIHETYLEIVNDAEEIVTVIEILSPKKKRPGRGRDLYERQREAIFGSDIHFIEIDLLRGWEPSSIYGPDEAGDYRILVSRSEQRPRAQLFTWNVLEPIPAITLPLTGTDELLIELKPALDQACDRTDLLVNYQQQPLPPLRFEEALWLETFLQQVGMRPCAS
ncbi:MAG: DUF4058 family protein [Phormidesmis sp.]